MTEQGITATTLAEAFRQALNPALNERLALQEKPPGAPHVRIACVSPTGATFDAVVASSKTHPHFGRVKAIENYKYPPVWHFGEREHGGAPVMSEIIDGKTRRYQGAPTPLTADQKHNLTQGTWALDLKTYVGKGLDPMIIAANQEMIAKVRAEFEAKMAEETARMVDAATAPVAQPVDLKPEAVDPLVAGAIEGAASKEPRKSK
jgi:hypothetical protein